MHIIIDARIINSSTGTYIKRLLHYLQTVDLVNTYTVLVPTKDIDYWQPTNPNFVVMAADFAQFSFAEQFAFKRFLDRLKPDLVHFCMPQQPIFYRGAHVTTIHDLTQLKTYNSDKNWFVYHFKQIVAFFVFAIVARTSKQVIAPTEYTKHDVMKTLGVSGENITVTYESADTTEGELEPYKHPFKRYILYVGQQSDYKNIKRLGEAHQQLLKRYPDLGLILVGKKNKAIKTNEDYFARQGYTNILFTDFINDSQRDWLYTNTVAYVFPSLLEGFGLPGLEAMGYGAPVVSSNATCLPEVYGDAAHYFDPKDVDAMTAAISDVLGDEILRQALITKGYEQLATYSWERMAKQTHQVYLDATKSTSL